MSAGASTSRERQRAARAEQDRRGVGLIDRVRGVHCHRQNQSTGVATAAPCKPIIDYIDIHRTALPRCTASASHQLQWTARTIVIAEEKLRKRGIIIDGAQRRNGSPRTAMFFIW